MYELLADVVMVLHAAIIVSLAIGVGVSIFVKRFRPIEAGALLSVIIAWSLSGGCPLTVFENYLRLHTAHPIPLARIGFIPYYTHQWLGFTASDPAIKMAAYASTIILLGLILQKKLRKE